MFCRLLKIERGGLLVFNNAALALSPSAVMNLVPQFSLSRRIGRQRVRAVICVMVGLMWALTPVFHGVVHLASVPHRHASGEVHRHGHESYGAEEKRREESSSRDWVSRHKRGETETHAGHEHQHNEQKPSPAEDESLLFFFSLDVAASEPVWLEASFIEPARPVGRSEIESLEVVSEVLIGAGGPRGPPLCA